MELTDELLYLYPYVSSLAISISYSELSPSDFRVCCDIVMGF